MRGDMHLVPAIFFPLIAGSEESRTGRMSNVPVFILLERVICFVTRPPHPYSALILPLCLCLAGCGFMCPPTFNVNDFQFILLFLGIERI
jgi:hypothetical protein